MRWWRLAVCNIALCLGSLCIALEAVGYASYYAAPGLYSSPASIVSKLSQEQAKTYFSTFLASRFSLLTGWLPPQNDVRRETSCGTEHLYSQDAYRVRTYTGYRHKDVQILLAGDSYSWGFGVDDDHTAASYLFHLSGMVAANLGYRGYDPVQAFMRLQAERPRFPNAKIAILGIMYENINRLVNAYRPAYSLHTDNLPYEQVITYGFKPYMKDSRLLRIDPNHFISYRNFIHVAQSALASDYWARPVHRFPYSASLFKAVSSHAFMDRAIMTCLKPWKRKYAFQYRNEMLGKNLFGLVSAFAVWAKQENLTPIVVFIPENANDTTSPDAWIAAHAKALPKDIIIQNLDFSSIDPKRYNGRANGDCHPSAYGYHAIAQHYNGIIQTLLNAPVAKDDQSAAQLASH